MAELVMRNSASKLEKALKHDRDIVHQLECHGLITRDVHDEALKPNSLLTDEEKSGLIVGCIRNKIELNHKNLDILLTIFKANKEKYKDIIQILDEEIERNSAAQLEVSVAKCFNIPLPLLHTSKQSEAELKNNTNKMIICFSRICRGLAKFIQHTSTTIETLKWLLKDYISCETIKETDCHRNITSDTIQNENNVSKLMNYVTSFSSFFNFKLVEDLIDQVNYEEGRVLLTEYKKKFEEYLNGRLTECPSGIAGETEDCVRFMVQLDESFKECRQTHLLTLRDDICEILKIERKHLVLDGIESGSIWIVYYLLEAVVPRIFPIKKEQIILLSKLRYHDSKLFTIICGGYYIEIRKFVDDEQAKREVSVTEDLPEYIEGCKQSLKGSVTTHSITDSKVYNKVFRQKLNTFKDVFKSNPLVKDNLGETALHWAVLTGKIDILKYLLKDCHCSAAVVNNHGQTVLHLAASQGNLDIVQYLVHVYRPMLSIDSYGLSPLHYAIISGKLEVIQLILKEYNIFIFQLLQQYRFFSSPYNLTAFHIAVAKGNKKVIQYLIAEAGECIQYDLTTLILAVPDWDICAKLLKNYHSNEHKGYALLAAIYGCHMHSIKHLLNMENLDLDFSDKLNRKIVHYAGMSGDPDVLRYILLEYIQKTFEQDISKGPFLYYSSLIIRDVTDKCNNTTLDYAALYGNYKMVKCIVNKYRYDPSIQKIGMFTPLHSACLKGHLDVVRYLIEECKCDPNIKDTRQHSPLDMASIGGHIEIFKYLVETHNCEVNCSESNRVSPIFYAVCNGHLSIIQYMIAKHYYNPSQRCEENDEVVLDAIRNGKLKLLIQNDICNPKITIKNKLTLLHATVLVGHLEDLKYLVEECNCDLTAAEEMGFTPVDYAVSLNHFSMFRYFVSQKDFDYHVGSAIIISIVMSYTHIVQYLMETNTSSANQHITFSSFLERHVTSGLTPIHVACACGDVDIAKYLVEYCHGEPEVKDENNYRPIHYAVNYGQLKVVQYLVESLHCDPYHDVDNVESALRLAIRMGHCNVVEYLIKVKTSEFNIADVDELLECAAQHGQLPILIFFMKEKIFSYSSSYEGLNPLNAAIIHGHLDVLQYLIKNYNLNPNVTDLKASQIPTLAAACSSGNLKILEYLILERNCNFSDEQWKALALFCAIHKGHLSIVKYLMENCNYKESVVDELNRTPLEYAAVRGHLSIVKYLVQHQPPSNKNRVFLFATIGNHIPVVQHLIEQCCTTSEDHLNDYVLYFAIQHGRAEIVKYLLKTNVYNPKVSFSNGLNIIQAASYFGHLNIVKYFVEEYTCNPHFNHNNNGTSLYLAAMAGQLETVEYLIQQNFDDPNNGGKYGGNFLHPVCMHGWLNIARCLIHDYNCDPNSIDDEGWPPLYYSVANGHLSTVKFLICDQEVNASTILLYGITSLHVASRHGHIHIVKFLTEECKCSLSAVDNFNKNPVYYAVAYGHIDIVKYYINIGIQHDGNLLMVACYHGHLDLVKYFINERGFDPLAKNSDGDMSLHTAAYGKQLKMLQYLIEECNCDPNLKGQHGRSLIHCASIINDMNMSKYLVEICKIDLMVRDIFECTPLHYTTQAGHADLVKYFIASGVSPNASDRMGNTPLHLAASYGKIDVVQYLVEEAAVNPSVFNNQGFTPLDMAQNRGEYEVVSYLSAIPSVSPNLLTLVQSSSVTEVQQNNQSYLQTESLDKKQTSYTSEMGTVNRVLESPIYEMLSQQLLTSLLKDDIGKRLQLILESTEEGHLRESSFIPPQINFNKILNIYKTTMDIRVTA